MILNTIEKGFNYFKEYGLIQTVKKVKVYIKDRNIFLKDLNNIEISFDLFTNDKNEKLFKSKGIIDILIPVYNGIEFLNPLFNSIIKNTIIPYRLIICDDKSPDDNVLKLLDNLKKMNSTIDITIIKNDQNLGFVKTVNKLVKYTNNHFVLLNTDVEVPPRWLERLMNPIFTMQNIATTTPFTNAGTICSFPNYLSDNPIFENMDIEELDKYFNTVDFKKTYIEIPTGVGFCMGVNKKVVDKIGMFDELFGKGYGEENDWCQRALKNGYKNIHVTNLFVYHKHGGSFPSDEKQRLIKRNLNLLNKKHLNYDRQVQLHIKKNELKNLREIIEVKIKNEHLDTVLIIDHNLGGGANHYIDENLQERLDISQMIILLRYDFRRSLYIIVIKYNDKTFSFDSGDLFDIFKFINSLKIKEIFLNSLVSYPNIKDVIDCIVKLKVKSSAKLILPIHDFFPLCPSFNLLNQYHQFCNLPRDKDTCNKCLTENKNEFKKFERITNIKKWRDSWKKIYNISDSIICFSNSSKDYFLKVNPEFLEKLIVTPHNIEGRYQNIYNSKITKKTIGILGGINEAKGAKIVKQLVKFIDDNQLDIKVVLIGQISIPIKSSSFIVTGRYNKEELPQLVQKYNITKFFIPSIWPETFSYTTDEIMQMGYPLVVFNLGAPAERVRDYKYGKVITIDNFQEVIIDI